MVLLNKEQIKEIIPHREPFLLVDEVIALEPGVKCIAQTTVKETDFWVPGHFPGYPVLPGVLLVEMLAQTGAICTGSLADHKGKIALFAKIDKCKFRRQIVVGDVINLEVNIAKMRDTLGVGKAVAKVGDEIACTCELTFAYQN